MRVNIFIRASCFLLLPIFSYYTYAQVLPLEAVINSSGGSSEIDGKLYDFNISEMVLVQTLFFENNLLITNGFFQPFYMLVGHEMDGVVVKNNFITPNNDGKNDYWIIEGLEKYPGSVVSVFDKSGRIIFKAKDYKSDWDGTYRGNPLSENAYYYYIDLGPGHAVLRGFISIVLNK